MTAADPGETFAANLPASPVNAEALAAIVTRALAPLDVEEIRQLANCNRRSALHYKRGDNLPGAVQLCRLRAHIPWLDEALRELERRERTAGIANPNPSPEPRQLSLRLFGLR